MDFSHIDRTGRVKMVDVSGKPVEKRTAIATGSVRLKPETAGMITDGLLEKGDPLATARIAAADPPPGQEDRVSSWYPSAVLHTVLR